jgi:hypothetical protein
MLSSAPFLMSSEYLTREMPPLSKRDKGIKEKAYL